MVPKIDAVSEATGGSTHISSSSIDPSQSLSSESQVSSVGVHIVQLSTTAPSTQVLLQVFVHIHSPQLVSTTTKSSSISPSQSSSRPLHILSSPDSPAIQLSATDQSIQAVVPLDWHAHTPHVVS